MKNNWYVITGGPSTGKTTLLAELEKLGYKTIPEAARLYIDEELQRGYSLEQIRQDEKRFQQKVLDYKITLEAELDPLKTIFLDRGMHDTIAYQRHYGFPVDKQTREAVQRSSYQNIFLLEPLPDYHDDYARIENYDFTIAMDRLLYDAYAEFGIKPIRVPLMTPAERAQFVLTHIQSQTAVKEVS